MTTLRKIQAELSKLDEPGLTEVLARVKSYVSERKRRKKTGPGVLAALAKVKKIQGPPRLFTEPGPVFERGKALLAASRRSVEPERLFRSALHFHAHQIAPREL